MQALHVEELQKANTLLQRHLTKVTQESSKEVGELRQRLEESENHVQQLLEAAHERDSAVLQLEKKARLFYEVVEHRSSIARILEVLDELSIGDEQKVGSGDSVNETSAVTATGSPNGPSDHDEPLQLDSNVGVSQDTAPKGTAPSAAPHPDQAKLSDHSSTGIEGSDNGSSAAVKLDTA